MQVVNSIAMLQHSRAGFSGSIGLVPTMGALHQGHITLVDRARTENDHVIVTIFVNPTQFSPDEDLAAYPRNLDADLEKLEAAGVDVVFTPNNSLMYPDGYQTYVEVADLTRNLEGGHRPGHFRGVTTIVTKLFNLTQAHRAYFGQKDAQQLVTIRRMVHDLNIPIEVIPCMTVREIDGLAMSSRNVYLSAKERGEAAVLYRVLQAAARAYDDGERNIKTLETIMQDTINTSSVAEPDYMSIVNAATLESLERADDDAVLLASLAVKIGHARLIDNMLIPGYLNTPEGLLAHLGNPQR
ncbi:MAG: pantoate--beta-alanine ligase [Aggregatilineales bacterium]